MKKATPLISKEMIIVFTVGMVVALGVIELLMYAARDTRSKRGRITSPPGVATGLRQIQRATVLYHMEKGKYPLSFEDLVGIDVPTSEGQTTQFSISLLEQQLGGKASTIKYFPEFRILDHGQVPTAEIVLAYFPESKDTQYCQVLYVSRESKGMKWVGVERMEVARVHQKIEWLTAYKNCIESNSPPPSANPREWPSNWCRPTAPMPR